MRAPPPPRRRRAAPWRPWAVAVAAFALACSAAAIAPGAAPTPAQSAPAPTPAQSAPAPNAAPGSGTAGYAVKPNSTARLAYVVAPEIPAALQLGKRRHYHGGKNNSVSEIAAELRQMPDLWGIDHNAVCNDGSVGMYYFKKGFNPSLWLMYIAGGPMCYDAASCAAQPLEFTTSENAPRSLFVGGIFAEGSSSKNIQFGDANTVWVPYCTSDGWAGDVGGPTNSTNGTQPWQYEGFPGGFRGQRILAATIKSMNKYLGFGATQSTRLLFGGCTPGVVYNLDNVNNIIRGLGIKQEMVTVQGIFDSAVVLDVQPLSPTTLPLANMTEMAFQMVNASGAVSSACAGANPDAPWRCLLGETALPYVQNPYLLVQSQFDRAQLSYNAPRPGHTPASVAYADAFQAASLDLLSSVPTAAQSHSAVFSPACFSYCTSLSAHFWSVVVQGGDVTRPGAGAVMGPHKPLPASLETVINWWFFKGLRDVRVVDDCTGFRCGKCHANAGSKGGKKHSRLDKEVSSLAAPLILGVFMLLISVGCCLACAANEPRRKRSLLRGGADEETPLMPKQRGGVAAPQPRAPAFSIISTGAAAAAAVPKAEAPKAA